MNRVQESFFYEYLYNASKYNNTNSDTVHKMAARVNITRIISLQLITPHVSLLTRRMSSGLLRILWENTMALCIFIRNNHLDRFQENGRMTPRPQHWAHCTATHRRLWSYDGHIIHRKYRCLLQCSDYGDVQLCSVVMTAVAYVEPPAHGRPPPRPQKPCHDVQVNTLIRVYLIVFPLSH